MSSFFTLYLSISSLYAIMRITSPTVLGILASGFFVSAAPAKGCNRVDAVYMLLKGSLQSQASSLCVQFLGGDQTIVQTEVR
jgi:hypothetical protein